MKDEPRPLLDRSHRAARRVFENGETELAAGRAYCAMFYAAEDGRRSRREAKP